MGFLKILRKQRAREREMRILILGLDNAGKTTLMKKFLDEPTDTIEPTLGFDIKTVHFKDFQLNLWDVGGQKSLRSYWKNYFESTDALIWVVDSSDRERLLQCSEELKKLLGEERLAGASLLVLANKSDLPGAIDVNSIAQVLDLHSIKSHHWKIFSCCALSGDRLVQAMTWLCDDVGSRLFILD
ncbi:ADP-ribosylation factor-like protein 2 [Caenorhabditis elegans]|uniref:ADP-ribosylation factor-like protein 2 n=1 Tax=Caenorhabditis elegans TaxID=6239 RepID=ARL2_CAEEL|nr:ADP-ribosylation factor-like protein 2 [Caenorhabditis elegans]Q19705.2 RecName: Full=ADP-ribosylation factor-like protein 2; AltName: Full=Abnormal eversion of vulva protein 20 [Caenorhabditis elegans]CAA90353.2 ADP-ribosylation factor-like protein 2 [Caenorhabditis elegans]|eukprot:NP_495779.1 ADP-ribosylation factor-like protein 2 [Caenorhabditis elegans]